MSNAADPTLNLVEIGDVPKEVVDAVNSMRGRANTITMELGRMEARKFHLIHELNRLETSAQGLLRSEGDRLGIPEGTPWQLTPEGKALAPLSVKEAQGG